MIARKLALAAALSVVSATALAQSAAQEKVDKVMNHYDRAHSGWNSKERQLTPAAVSGGNFGQLWATPQLDSFDDTPPRLFASPLFLPSIRIGAGQYRGRTFDVAFLVTTTGYAYAVSTAASGSVQPGTILWRTQLVQRPCSGGRTGNYSTPVIDKKSNRIYITACAEDNDRDLWSLTALDLRTGQQLDGWPIEISREIMEHPQLNRNGTRTWRYGPPTHTYNHRWLQRAGLNMSADGERIYVAFGANAVGWMVVVDAKERKVASAFSATSNDVQDGGGMWGSGGPVVDEKGRIYMTTGSNRINGVVDGLSGMYPESEHSWAHSILQWEDDRTVGLTLTGTYTPYNYCQAGKADIDLGSSAPILIDVPADKTATPNLLILGGTKQGNIYLLDRDNMPGSVTKRQPCTIDPAEDKSLLAPEVQPEWQRRGPINLFKPFSDEIGAFDQAKSRSTSSYYRDSNGDTWIYVTGSSKVGVDYNTSAPPSVARVKLVTTPGEPAYLRVDKLETVTTLHNPGSPIVSSNGGNGAIMWVVDQNAPRTANLYGENPTKPILYAFDAVSLKILFKTEPGALFTTGNYGEVTVLNGMVLVGTDRLQAFGLKQ